MKILLYGSSQTKRIKEIFSRHGIEVVNLVEEDYNHNAIVKIISFIHTIKKVDYIYMIYNQSKFNWRFMIARIFGRKTISHWIGSDILEAQEKSKSMQARLNYFFTSFHLAVSPLIKKELEVLGINSIEIPIAPDFKLIEQRIVCKQHSVLAYLPQGKEKFYGIEYIEKLAEHFPNISFHIVANTNDSINRENVFFHGMLSSDELDELYNKITILLRITEHDGLPVMILEALARGKQIIYSFDFPYAYTPKSKKFEDVLEVFIKVISSKPKFNQAGLNYVHNTYNESNVMRDYEKIFGAYNE